MYRDAVYVSYVMLALAGVFAVLGVALGAWGRIRRFHDRRGSDWYRNIVVHGAGWPDSHDLRIDA